MSVQEAITIVLISALISALVSGSLAAYISFRLNRQHTKHLLKLDVLRRVVGYRFVLTKLGVAIRGEPFIALNEAFVVYADHPEVISSLRKMHEELGLPDRMPNNLLSLVKAMAEAVKMPAKNQLNDSFFLRPFTPGS